MSSDVSAPYLSTAPGSADPGRVWWMRTPDGTRLRAALWSAEAPRGHVILLTGRTEFLEKAAIPARQFVARGWSVVSLDWRGQGLSDRLADPGLKGHIDDYASFQTDLDTLLDEPAVQALPGPRLLVGHSMGGAISAAALARPEVSGTLAGVILSAPMFGIRMSGPARAAAWLVTRVGLALGRAERWPPFGDVATPYVLSGPTAEDNVLTGDPAVWDWMVETLRAHPELGLAMPTLGWFDASSRETRRLAELSAAPCPVLMLLGSAEEVVDPDAIRAAATRLGATLHEIPGARHEVLIERADLRDQAWAGMDAFLDRLDLPASPG